MFACPRRTMPSKPSSSCSLVRPKTPLAAGPLSGLRSYIPAHYTMIYVVAIFIVIIFLITTITYLVWNYSVVAPPLQPEHNAETEINNATLSTWPTLTYAEAKSRDLRAVNVICCSICLVDYEEEGEDKALRASAEVWTFISCNMCGSVAMAATDLSGVPIVSGESGHADVFSRGM